MYQKVEALVVRRTDLREHDRIITFYSRECGRVQAIARGVRKSGSKRAVLFEPFRVLEVVLRESKRGNLLSISDISPLKEFTHICGDLECLSAGFHILSMLARLTPADESEPELFQLAVDSLENLDCPGIDSKSEILQFELTFLKIAGLFPEIRECCECGQNPFPIGEKSDSMFLSPRLGGVLCRSCARKQTGSLRADDSVLRWLRGEYSGSVPAGLPGIMDRFYRYHYSGRYSPPLAFDTGHTVLTTS
ncbi:MAG: DNA repair protein RecO [bacterium]|nr:DNA repair protein RecO [bacterium]